jgi:2-dehydropantoate 2-reductase
MRFHVIGVGSIGTLISFHLKKTSRLLGESAPQTLQQLPHKPSIPYLPSPFTLGVILRLTRSSFQKVEKRSDKSVYLERDSAKERESGFGIEVHSSVDQIRGLFSHFPKAGSDGFDPRQHLPGTSRLEELGYPKGSIDSLIVTTKAQHTISALRPLLPHITSGTTIVLLQNGQGVLDLLLEKLFTDPSKRPQFILASTTHGAWMKNKLSCVHAAFGKIDFGVVPNRSLGKAYERMIKAEEVEDDELREGHLQRRKGELHWTMISSCYRTIEEQNHSIPAFYPNHHSTLMRYPTLQAHKHY